MEYKLPKRIEKSNKATYGKVLNIAGSDFMMGAAYLSSVAALKIGCGYNFLYTTEAVKAAVGAKTSNVVFVKPSKFVDILQTIDVVSIGCGLDTDSRAKNIFDKFLKYTNIKTPIVVDADGLNIISCNPQKFIDKKFNHVIFTPHPKEAARLLNVDSVVDNIEEAASLITKKYNCVTVLKTEKTFICSPDGQTYTNTTGNNAMAKAGSGDVLTGMISGLIAQGMDCFEGSCLGVYLHGLSGDIAAKNLSQYCVMAEDLINFLPQAVKTYLS